MSNDVERMEVISPDEAQAQAVILLSERKRPELMTELSDEEIKLLTIIEASGNYADNDVLLNVVKSFMLKRVSLNRKGVEEIIKVAVSKIDEKIKKGIRDYLGGGR